MKIFEITNLPPPNYKILERIKEFLSTTDHAPSIYWRDNLNREVYHGTENISFSGNITDDVVTHLVKDQYQQYFKDPIGACFNYMYNIDSSKQSASLPPHVHRLRQFAIHYFYELGGDDVRTYFHTTKPYRDRLKNLEPKEKFSGFMTREDTIPYQYIRTETNKWYAHSILLPHSVENITATLPSMRLLLGIVVHPTYETGDLMCESALTLKDAITYNA
jgi:hypothetical protein